MKECEYNYCYNDKCDFRGTIAQQAKHRLTCRYAKIMCLVNGCTHIFVKHEIGVHLNEHHKDIKFNNIEKEYSRTFQKTPANHSCYVKLMGGNDHDYLAIHTLKKDYCSEVSIRYSG
jgi:hypothetical protein